MYCRKTSVAREIAAIVGATSKKRVFGGTDMPSPGRSAIWSDLPCRTVWFHGV